MLLVDSHTHINLSQYDQDRSDTIHRAHEAGIRYILDIGTDLKSSQRAVQNSEKYESVYAVAGLHPHDASKMGKNDLQKIENLFRFPKVVALGEIGLDYHYQFSPKSLQKEVFGIQLAIAREHLLPVVIHVRDAMTDALKVIDSVGDPPWRGVFHCYSGTAEGVEEVLRRGFSISFTGVVTFKNFKHIERILAVPQNKLLLETDAPYMAPVPLRGKRNEPAFIVHTAKKIAEVYNISLNTIASVTTRNAVNLFQLRH